MVNQPFWQHVLRNLSLICLSIIFLPLTTTVVALCLLYGRLSPPRRPCCAPKPRKTVLVSSLTMAKGLFIARAFYLAGHRVIGLDFEREGIPSSGKHSKALSGYYELRPPRSSVERKNYAQKLVEIIEKEGVDLWVCVSEVTTTMEDAAAKQEIESRTPCKVFQFSPETCDILHDKHQFIKKTKDIGLAIPETRLVKSHMKAFDFLRGKPLERYILKSVWLNDTSRADMTLYPRPTQAETNAIISRLEITAERSWVFQEFVEGKEYCTHAVVVKGRVKAFVSCPSSEMLLHYRALPANSIHSRKILEFTETYARGLEDGNATGQLSFDLIVKESNDELHLYPIECNPRTHTAIALFGEDAKTLAGCYLSLLDDPQAPPTDAYIPNTTTGYYWIGHDIVTLVFLPLLHISDFSLFRSALWEFIQHLLYWKDATFEVWDPLPFWYLYHLYWPCLFIWSLWKGEKWSRINVSTTRMFKCS